AGRGAREPRTARADLRTCRMRLSRYRNPLSGARCAAWPWADSSLADGGVSNDHGRGAGQTPAIPDVWDLSARVEPPTGADAPVRLRCERGQLSRILAGTRAGVPDLRFSGRHKDLAA